MTRVAFTSLRIVREKTVHYPKGTVVNAKSLVSVFGEVVGELDREACWVVCLDTKNKLNSISQVSVGSLASSSAHPREVFKLAVLSNASGIIFLHNHPSGDPEPSPEDHAVTMKLRESANLLGIRFLDHIVLGSEGQYYSFADHGDL